MEKYNIENIKKTMDFEEFDKIVKTYYPLNIEKTRYLILFKDGYSLFYKRIKDGKFFLLEREY